MDDHYQYPNISELTGDPLLHALGAAKEVFWTNPLYQSQVDWSRFALDLADVQDAEARLHRFAPFIRKVFPETNSTNGIIESPLTSIPNMQRFLENHYQQPLPGQLFLKCDSHLPISGSIKARGGIYEVLKHAEQLAIQHGLLTPNDDYSILSSERYKRFFAQFSLAVGSTGNLGLSIGIIGAKLGFKVTVHMSGDAKAWKKALLRQQGVTVKEYQEDYNHAVAEGRKQIAQDRNGYFVDDENSPTLFLGYAVAALRLQQQFIENKISVDEEHPLFVYLPCGVGGAPGGITFGLKLLFGSHVHCFFAEPIYYPCMLLGLKTGLHDQITVKQIGLEQPTDADGLAVGRPSRFVSKLIAPLLSGCYTIGDQELYTLLYALSTQEKINLEPSALAGLPGATRLLQAKAGQAYLQQHSLQTKLSTAYHLVWATGGQMVPQAIMNRYIERGRPSAD